MERQSLLAGAVETDVFHPLLPCDRQSLRRGCAGWVRCGARLGFAENCVACAHDGLVPSTPLQILDIARSRMAQPALMPVNAPATTLQPIRRELMKAPRTLATKEIYKNKKATPAEMIEKK